jgi:hypothetical protein
MYSGKIAVPPGGGGIEKINNLKKNVFVCTVDGQIKLRQK